MRLVLASASPRRAELLAAAGFTFTVSPVDVDESARPDEAAADYVRRLASEKSGRALRWVAGPAKAGPHTNAGPYTNAGAAKAGLHEDHTARPQAESANASTVGSGFNWVNADGVGSGFSWVNAGGASAAFSRFDDVTIVGADTVVVVDELILGKPRTDDAAREMLRRLSGRPHEVITGVSLRVRERELTGFETTRVWCAPLTAEEIEWYVATGEGRDKAGAYAIQGRASRFIPRIEGSYSNVVGLPIALIYRLLESLSRVTG